MKKLLFIVAGLFFLSACNNTPASAPTPAPAETSDWEYIKQKGELIIGLDDSFPPMGFRDEANNLVGFDIDFAKAVCAELGLTPVFQPIDWDAKEMELDGKHIDCIWNGMSITQERKENMSLTRGYLNNRIIIMTVPGVAVNSKDDLKTLNVGTQAKSAALEVCMDDPIYDELENFFEYGTYEEVIMDMDTGRIQAMIVDEVLGMYKNSMRSVSFVVSPVDFGDDLYAVGFRKDDKELTRTVQQTIDNLIASGKAAEISNAWFGADIVIKP